jgi:hypothetical protein
MPPVKNVGEPCAGEPHARFDVGGGRKPGQSAKPRGPGASRRPYRHPPRQPRSLWTTTRSAAGDSRFLAKEQSRRTSWRPRSLLSRTTSSRGAGSAAIATRDCASWGDSAGSRVGLKPAASAFASPPPPRPHPAAGAQVCSCPGERRVRAMRLTQPGPRRARSPSSVLVGGRSRSWSMSRIAHDALR